MYRTLLALTALVTITSHVSAGQAVIQATGTLASGSAGSGPFAGVTVGSPVTLKFEVNIPGTPQSASWTNYVVDQPTFLLTIGTQSTGLNTMPTTNCGFRNNDPGVDGIWMPSAPLAGGGNLEFTFSSINGLMFNSTNPLTNLGTWTGGNFYSVYGFAVMGPGMFLDLDFQTFSISEPSIGTPTCFGDGTGAACGCGNLSTVGEKAGCVNSLAVAAKLRGVGNAIVASDTLVLNATQVPNGPGLYFQGSGYQGAGAGFTFGDGILCAGGTLARLGVVFASGSASSYPGGSTPAPISIGGGCNPGDVRVYQMWYRDASTTFCTPAVFNLTNALEITWS